MATDTTGSTQATTPAAGTAPPTSAPAGTPGQGDTSSSLLSSPAATKAGGTTEPATQPGEPKAAKDGASADGKPTGETPAADITLKLPDGFKADEKVLGEFKTIAKQSGMTSEAAQKIFDLYAGATAQAAAQWKSQAESEQTAQSAKWAEAARADKEFGGKDFDANIATAQKAVVRFGGEGLVKVLNEKGWGNHPELIRAFVRAGKAISEDNTRGAQSSGGVSSEQALHDVLYPTMKKD